MKDSTIVYVHDFCFLKEVGTNHSYTAVGMPEDYFDRFFDSGFKEVNIISRNKCLPSRSVVNSGFKKIDNSKISIPLKYTGYLSLISPLFIYGFYKEVSKADVVVINFPSVTGVYSWLFNLILKKPYTVEVAADANQFGSKKGGGAFTKLIEFLFPKVVNRSCGCIYVSNHLKNKYPHDNGLVASNVILREVNNTPSKKTHLGRGKPLCLLFVGGVNKRKGIVTLIESIRHLVQAGRKDVLLNIVGGHMDYNYEELVEQYNLASNIKFLGLLNSEEVRMQMKEADIYLQPSFAEGIPRATLEAMSLGIPVIATTLPGFKEILSDEYLVEPGDYIGVCNKIDRFVECDNYRNQAVENNLNTIRSFNYERLHGLRTSFYKRTIEAINERV
ncbi:glycosyltransferase family 4 protein [Vibrio astriarenae]